MALQNFSAKQLLHEVLKYPFICYAAVVLSMLWLLSLLGVNYFWIYIVTFIFLYHIDKRHLERTHRRIRHEEKKFASQKKLLSDVERARWLNVAVEKIWPVFLEKFVSQEFLMPLAPFFLEKYKPWTAKKAVLQSLTLGRTPPTVTGIRALEQGTEDDHLVLEAFMEFVAADDMTAILAVQMRKYLGFGLWTTIHVSNVHLEGKVRIGLRFLGEWPFLSRARVCFENAPYLQMTARPLSSHGIDVAELPGIASWLDGMMVDALEQTLVAPNVLVVDVERLASFCMASMRSSSVDSQPVGASADWFYIDEKSPRACVRVEILDATQLKPSDANGLADPFVKGTVNGICFKTSVKKKTLSPKWMEEFQIPVPSWGIRNILHLRVRDKDTFHDDDLGYCEIPLAKYRGGNRHEICLPLKGIKTGRLRISIKIEEDMQSLSHNPSERAAQDLDLQLADEEQRSRSFNLQQPDEQISPMIADSKVMAPEALEESNGGDDYEGIDFGSTEPGIFSIMRPGRYVQQFWYSRRSKKGNEAALLQVRDEIWDTALSEETDSEEGGSPKTHADRHGKRRSWKWWQSPKERPKCPQENEKHDTAASPTSETKAIPEEFVTIGNKGTKMKLILKENAEPSGSSSQLSSAVGKHDKDFLHGALGNGQNHSEKGNDLSSPKKFMSSMARGVKKGTEKTAHHLGHALGKAKDFDKENLIKKQNGSGPTVESRTGAKYVEVNKQDFSGASPTKSRLEKCNKAE